MVVTVRDDQRHLLSSMDQVASTLGAGSAENEAFQHVRDNIDGLNKMGIEETDLIFLKGLLDGPVVGNLLKVQDRLEGERRDERSGSAAVTAAPTVPVSLDNERLLGDLVSRCGRSHSREARELCLLLGGAHVRALIASHDQIGQQQEETANNTAIEQNHTAATTTTTTTTMHGETIRVLGLRKSGDEPLGLTVQVDESTGYLLVARIMGGGVIDRQGLLRVGDVILEVNGTTATTPEQLQAEICRAKDTVNLKIRQGGASGNSTALGDDRGHGSENGVAPGRRLTCYMRALYDYDPVKDTLLPCREIGLAFTRGDILQIVDQRDPNWWQAKKMGSEGGEGGDGGPAGLIPSLELEERRKAFVAPEADYVHRIGICGARVSKKKRKVPYRSEGSGEFDKAELPLYEEVTRMPPFRRKTLALVGPSGVGRRTLKNRLVNSEPHRFGAAVPHTSRPPRPLEEDGRDYVFWTRERMEQDVRDHRFLEYGEHNGHLYGTHLDTVRSVVQSGRMCVLDCSPAALKLLHNSAEFLPYVMFIAAPGMEQLQTMYGHDRHVGHSSKSLAFDRQSSIRFSSRRARTLESLASLYEEDDLRKTVEESACLQRAYHTYIDLVLVNEDFDVTFRRVVQALESLATEHQWVPVNWIY